MPIDPAALARALVLALFPALAEAIRMGTPPRSAFDAAWRLYGKAWREAYGADVAREAAAALDELMAYHVIMPHGRAMWFGLGPVADLTPPREAIRTPREAIEAVRSYWRQLWGEAG